MMPMTHTDALRSTGRELADELDELADDLESGDATAADVRERYCRFATAMVELEDAASTTGTIDDETSRARAIDEARKAIYHLASDKSAPAITSLVTAAEHVEAAHSDD